MALAPGIARKVKKVLETPVDSPEILSCLRSLSDFYPENTPAARRGLRRSVERHGLEINREYLVASNRAQEALRAVDGQLERLLDSCDRIGGALERTRERTGALLRETAELDAVIASVEEKKKIVATFAVDFQLTDEDVAALEGRPLGHTPDAGLPDGHTTTNAESVGAVTDAFFVALDRARAIHGNCRALLRTHHQRAGLELMDQMATYQERAHERLCRWVQSECRALAEEDISENVSDLLTKAMKALRRRPTLFRYCVEEVSRARHNALFRRFIGALTRGGPGGVPRPIEAHASDPKRYVSDMLGWLHQAAAGEKELVAALLGDDVYGFAELIAHPICAALVGTTFAWLVDILNAFNDGDLHAYDALCVKHADALNAQPALVAHERKLREKITILCLLRIVFAAPADEREIDMETIAQRTKLTVDGVEYLLMKALSARLIEGVIDQVAGKVNVTWVQPRVLLLPQIAELGGRLDGWIEKVRATGAALSEEVPQLAATA